MFSLIWRFFPGPAWLRIVVIVAVLLAIVWALVTWVYPYVAEMLMWEDSTVTGAAAIDSAVATETITATSAAVTGR